MMVRSAAVVCAGYLALAVVLYPRPLRAEAQGDLVPQVSDVTVLFNTTVPDGDVAEGCAEMSSGIDLVRFSTVSRNIGDADIVLGDPQCPPCTDNPLAICGNPNFMCSPGGGHNHPHFQGFADYDLLDSNGQTVVSGHKSGFCLRDSACANPKYTCLNQGISARCADDYGWQLGCQYVDVTDVPSGDYTLRVTINPLDRIPESNTDNNTATVSVHIAPRAQSACAAAVTLPADGGSISGTTSGAGTLSSSCGNSGQSPEQVFAWTPSVSGTATIQTCSDTDTSFDTVVYVRDADCSSGSEIACNDDTAGCGISSDGTNPRHGSVVTPSVQAGETYFIVLDGSGGAAGQFRLTVQPPGGPSVTPETPTVTPSADAPSETPTATNTPAPLFIPSFTPTETPTPTPTASPDPTSSCPGDCSGSSAVTVADLVTMVNMVLQSEPAALCPAGDLNADGQIEVSEIIAAVNSALDGCPGATAARSRRLDPAIGVP